MVKDFIIEEIEGRQWNIELLDECFGKTDVQHVLRFPLSIRRCPDRLIWNDSKIGVFNVKSAYCLSRHLLGKVVPSMDFRSPLWKLVWRSNTLPKIKLFVCRLFWGIISIRLNFQLRTKRLACFSIYDIIFDLS
ncbi:hypothetical protein REPUB_Repub08aG0063500 [Reevesia pubescens]